MSSNLWDNIPAHLRPLAALDAFLAWLKKLHLPNYWIKAYVAEWFKRNEEFFDQRHLIDAGWRPPFTPQRPGGDIGGP